MAEDVAISFSLRQRGNTHKKNFLVGGEGGGGRNMRISSLTKKKTSLKFQ